MNSGQVAGLVELEADVPLLRPVGDPQTRRGVGAGAVDLELQRGVLCGGSGIEQVEVLRGARGAAARGVIAKLGALWASRLGDLAHDLRQLNVAVDQEIVEHEPLPQVCADQPVIPIGQSASAHELELRSAQSPRPRAIKELLVQLRFEAESGALLEGV